MVGDLEVAIDAEKLAPQKFSNGSGQVKEIPQPDKKFKSVCSKVFDKENGSSQVKGISKPDQNAQKSLSGRGLDMSLSNERYQAKEVPKLDQNSVKKPLLSGVLGRGLRNLGNTCYLNATVQALSKVVDISKASRSAISREFARLCADLQNAGKPINATKSNQINIFLKRLYRVHKHNNTILH